MTTPLIPTRVAFIGAGSMARAHARALTRLSIPAHIEGVFDADTATSQEFAAMFGTKSFASLSELLSSTRPEVVHVCTTAGTHFDVAHEAILAGAHVYVEKPMVETLADARALLALARRTERLVCAGHQLLADPVYEKLISRAPELQPVSRIESVLAFASPTVRSDAPPAAHAAQLLDVVPHPLYTLIDALERTCPGDRLSVSSCRATADSVDVLIDAGKLQGRLQLSLVDRPVSSTLSVTGGGGTLTADFIRGCVTGTANPGTSPIEKILNPVFGGFEMVVRSIAGIARRFSKHGEYPGLVALLERFYTAVRNRGASPLTSEHLIRVSELYEHIAAAVRASVAPRRRILDVGSARDAQPEAPVVAVTGVSGFLGRRIAVSLAARGFRVRGIGRGADPHQEAVDEWVRADISRGVPSDAFRDVFAVVHAAAATSGGFGVHQRGSIDSAAQVTDAAIAASVRRFVHVSSLSVLSPPRSYGELQNELTPLARNSRWLGPYAWGKTESEHVVVTHATAARLPLRIIRPAALTDRREPELPGLAGRRLFDRWHLLLGRPSHAFAACDVDLAAQVIAWTVADFDDAPPVLNLLDPGMSTRDALLRRMRKDGWRGHGVWVPIWMLAAGITTAKWVLSTLTGKRGERMDVWQVLRPRRLDASTSERVIAATLRPVPAPARRSDGADLSRDDLQVAVNGAALN
jgi:predicted dehydrogenase/nucleoside-diphosphate-sugar epimerase